MIINKHKNLQIWKWKKKKINKHGEHKGNNKQKLAEHELLKAIF